MEAHHRYESVFNHFDVDKDGKISPSELQEFVRAMGGEMSLAEAVGVVETSDEDGDGLLGLEEFARLVEGGEEEEKMEVLTEAFRMYQMEDIGCITPNSLKRMLSRLGDKRRIDECEAMISAFDLNGDGVLDFHEFKLMMS
ncbi:hypothetical protein Nepgr_027539 [Nepenthes gracilis]|uniref:EF-hand domain-containing protein n=1 Tax=Nepenthes gracilis TaxID=150966 RepID=A0AAD3Y3M7_NEPGR|nr:hypothetical protein Nepgr_027539 [Nepenthes gracilis]